MKTEKKPASK